MYSYYIKSNSFKDKNKKKIDYTISSRADRAGPAGSLYIRSNIGRAGMQCSLGRFFPLTRKIDQLSSSSSYKLLFLTFDFSCWNSEKIPFLFFWAGRGET